MPFDHVCPRCEQDWVRPYRFKDDGTQFLLCPECDSMWWPGETVAIPYARQLDDVVSARLGVAEPWTDRVWADVLEPVPGPAR
jgi:hypothetical protein